MLAALPGIREIRSALAGGYLWLLFLWLLLDPTLGSADFAGEPYRSAHHLGQMMGPLALGAAVTFAAYLLGTFVNEGRNVMAQIYLFARQSETLTPDIAKTRLSKRIEWRRKTRLRRYRDRLRRQRRREETLERAWISLTRPLGLPDQSLVVPGLFLTAVEGLGGFIRGFATIAASLLTLPLIGLEAAGIAILQSLIAMRAEPYKPFLTRQGVERLDRYLRSRAQLRDSQLSIADLISEFPVVRARLIHDSIDTVNEVDRLVAESEFRSAIVPPLMFLVGLLALDTSLAWLLPWPVLLTLLNVARERRRESGDLLVDALCRGVVVPPSLDPDSPLVQEGAPLA
ncbi:MAG: hypothetical protein ACTHK3_09670 [Solirubrobacterales bacterium]